MTITAPTPKHLIVPTGIVADGYVRVQQVLDSLDIPHDPWQKDIARYGNGLRDDGTYAAQTVGVSVARQAGKTYTTYTAFVVADCILHPGTTVVWSAHRASVATETARNIIDMCRGAKFARYIDQKSGLKTSQYREEITFRNGSRIIFKARESGAIRGLAKIRKIILDEAQILGDSVLPDMLPTLAAAWNPQVVMLGTPPKPGDNGEAFTALRDKALAGETSDVLWVEYGAPEGANLDDVGSWLAANPAFAVGRVPVTAIQRLRDNFPADDDFSREALGMWDHADNGEIISERAWLSSTDEQSVVTADKALGIEVGPDGVSTSLVVAGSRPDGRKHVELVEQRTGWSWVPAYVQGFMKMNPDVRAIVIDEGSSSRVLRDEFTRLRIKWSAPRVNDIGVACMTLLDGLNVGDVLHTGQPQMNLARQGARQRKLGDTGMWAWSRKNSLTDITPIVAATLALWGTQAHNVRRPGSRRGSKVFVPHD